MLHARPTHDSPAGCILLHLLTPRRFFRKSFFIFRKLKVYCEIQLQRSHEDLSAGAFRLEPSEKYKNMTIENPATL
jgi:hypothetical protein